MYILKMLFFKRLLLWSVALLFGFSYPCFAIFQHATTSRETKSEGTATLIIAKFETTYQTELGKLLAAALPTFIRASFLADQYKWLKVETDSTRLANTKRFELIGKIRDLGNLCRVVLQIVYIDKSNQKEELPWKSYWIVTDSILIQTDRMSRDLAATLHEYVFPKKNGGLHVLIYPFANEAQDSKLIQIGDYLTSSLLRKFEESPVVSSVKAKTQEIDEGQVPQNFNLVLKSSYWLYKDTLKVVATMLEAKTGQKLYTTITEFEGYDLWSAPEEIADKFENFLRAYSDIRNDLVNLQTAKNFYEHGRKYESETSATNSQAKAEIMYRKAIETDSRYIPALIRLGDLLKAEEKYDEAILIYLQALKIDSLQAEAHIGLGEAYYYTSESDLAFIHLRRAAKTGELLNNKTVVAAAYKLFGQINSEKEDYYAAINYFESALQFEKNDVQLWYELGNAYFLRYAESTQQLEDTTDIYLAVNCFSQGMERFPVDSSFARNAVYLLLYWGKVYQKAYFDSLNNDPSRQKEETNQLLDLASKKFTAASQLENNDKDLTAESLCYLALFALQNDEYEKAKEISRKAVELKPGNEMPYRLFADLHKNDTTYVEEALRSIKKALAISESAFSYQVLGHVYLKIEKPDSAFDAFQSAKNMEDAVTSETLWGLYQSSKRSENLEKIKSTVIYLQNILTADTKNRDYLAWLITLERMLKRYDKIESALKTYMKQGIAKNDSIWTYLRLAENCKEQKKFNETLRYLKQTLELNPHHKYAFTLLDSLYSTEAFKPALELKISVLERNLKKEGKSTQFRTPSEAYVNLAMAYDDIKKYKEGIHAIELAFKSAENKRDSSLVYYFAAAIYFNRSKGDTTKSGLENMVNAKQYAEKASELLPYSTLPLNILQVIYHEYIIDYEKAYSVSLKLLSLDSLDTAFLTNAIEATLSARRFEEASIQAEKILMADSLGEKPLQLESKLAMRFILIASKLLEGKILEANAEFGDFKRDYKKWSIPKEHSWKWDGTEKFLQTYTDISPFARNLLLDILKVLKLKDNEKKTGISILETTAEDSWRKCISEISMKKL